MECHGELAGSGAAKRRRERRLRQWQRHERQTVRMALCKTLHRCASGGERCVYFAPRGPKARKAGGRPSVLKEPEPRRVDSSPLLEDASEVAVHALSCAYLRSALQKEKKEEEEQAKVMEELAVLPWSQLTPDQRGTVMAWLSSKRKKKRKEKLPRTSSFARTARPWKSGHSSASSFSGTCCLVCLARGVLRPAWFDSEYMFMRQSRRSVGSSGPCSACRCCPRSTGQWSISVSSASLGSSMGTPVRQFAGFSVISRLSFVKVARCSGRLRSTGLDFTGRRLREHVFVFGSAGSSAVSCLRQSPELNFTHFLREDVLSAA